MSDRSLLDAGLLERISSRAAGYDRDNAFFTEDLAELTAAGYLRALVPESFGGVGLTLRETAREQQRLAAAAPAPAPGVNMHLVWTGVAKAMHDRGLGFLDFVLEEAAAGGGFGFGISEGGNDLVLFGSRTEAAPQPDGGYRFTGTKVFTSLSPAWTRLGLFGLDSTSADAPKLVHAFVRREDGGFRIPDDWDTPGMRATQSNTPVLEGRYAPPERALRPPGPGPNPRPLIFGIFANFEVLLAAVYTGIAARALELAVEAVNRRTSMKNDGAPLAHDPDLRRRIADAALAYDALPPQIDAIARDVDELADHGSQWVRQLVGGKNRGTETAPDRVRKAIR